MRLLKVAVLAAALLTLGLCAPAFADASTTVDLNPLVNAVSQVVIDTVVAVLGIVGLWLSMELKKKWGIDIEASVRSIEANHRDALHSAVETWTNAAITKFGGDLKFDVGNPALKFIVDGVNKSAPDAVKYLGATENWIVNKAAGLAGVTPVFVPAMPAAS